MQIELVAYTQPNPALHSSVLQQTSDLAALEQGDGTFAESLMEYAGRVCYASTARMGTAPNFLPARIREAHEDIIEHVAVTLRLRDTDEPLHWRTINRHCEVTREGDTWLVTGNARVWLDFFRRGVALEALPIMRQIAPRVYAELAADASPPVDTVAAMKRVKDAAAAQSLPIDVLAPAHDGPMTVSLLGFTRPLLDDPEQALHHGTATFFFEGISRACTHQLVRHRLASFSQESQRYVNLGKGGWKAVIPPAVQGNAEALMELEAFWQMAEEKYTSLRALGIRKEDARFLLPNAAETRIMTSMNFAAWSHFLWLRAVDKAAQWEIRQMGQRALEMLYAIAPDVFREHWDVYQKQFVERS